MKKSDRIKIFEKYGGKCAYCGCDLTKNWHADHIEPIVRDSKWDRKSGRFVNSGTYRNPRNEILENFNPACPSCNIQKNSFTLEQFRSNIQGFLDSLNLYNTQYKFVKKYGLVTETKMQVKFFFETFSGEVQSKD